MNHYLGNFATSKTVRIWFNTLNGSNVLKSLASGSVQISKDGSDITPSGGVTLATDVGSVVGLNLLTITMSTDTTSFAANHDYSARLAGSSTIDGVSAVGLMIGQWSVQNRTSDVATWGAAAISDPPLPTSAYTAPDNDGINAIGVLATAIKAVTDKLDTALMSVASTWQVIVGANNDKTGYGVTSNADKTGYSLSAAGLDSIPITDPGSSSNHTTFPKILVAAYRMLWRKRTMTSSAAKLYADDGTTVDSTATVSDDGTTQTIGAFN